MLGAVIVNEQKIEKAGSLVQYSEDMKIRIKGQENPYVSRGGFKLKKAIDSLLVLSKGKEFLILGLLQGALRTVPYRKELPMCMLWMSEPINWLGN
ncbi:hemolysin TlyA family protein [Fusobacterium necrophorum subsp. necrophorum]|nr:hemolysin TlyA family protein [Fusobacterium necrophorum subsp. necrophorum]